MRFGRFGPVMTAMITPMHKDGAVNYDEAERLARWLCDHGTTSLVVAGTTGEAPTLTDAEKLRLFETVSAAVNKRVPVIANTGSNDTHHSMVLSKQAQSCGVDALMTVAPYYNKPPQAGLLKHFTAIADATTLPLVIYNIPGRTAVNILPDTMVALAAHPRIVAVKESSGDIGQIGELASRVPAHFDVYAGDDHVGLPATAVGARGVVSVASHVAGNTINEMLHAYSQGDVDRATRLHHSMLPLFRGLFAVPSPIPVKAAMQLFGFATGSCRPPLCELSAEQLAALRAIVEPWFLQTTAMASA